MGEYFTTRVTRERKDELDIAVAELINRGFELVSINSGSETRKLFDLNSKRGAKKQFSSDYEVNKYVATLRRASDGRHAVRSSG